MRERQQIKSRKMGCVAISVGRCWERERIMKWLRDRRSSSGGKQNRHSFSVRSAGIFDTRKRIKAPWKETSKRVGYLLEKGEPDSAAYLYPRLFESVRTLIYNGIYDTDCNFMGTDAWISTQHWSYRDEFLRRQRAPWMVGSKVAGHLRCADKLTQVVVEGAGHWCPWINPRRRWPFQWIPAEQPCGGTCQQCRPGYRLGSLEDVPGSLVVLHGWVLPPLAICAVAAHC
jgi:hypothetical protein